MADINARLLQAIDGSAPQHKVRGQNRFEFSEGSDRTLHVKIAGKNGNPLDFEGDKFPVEDKQLQSVINELNKVKSELESIKNGTLKVKNDQLIDKIDALLAKQQSLEDKINSVMQGNAFRTQLTGSSTALEIIRNSVVNLEPEQELVSDYFDNTSGNFSNFFINLYRAGQNNWQITVEISYDKSGHWRRVVRREILTPLEGEFQTLKGFDLAPYYINFRLKNIGSSISTFYNVVVTFTR